jgi:hypothetical protein
MLNDRYLDLFWYWIRERESIRIKKERGDPMPWTKDPVLSLYHFCNVRREDDRGTKEIRAVVQQWITNVDDLPWAYTLARLFNKAHTLAVVFGAMKTESNWVQVLKIMHRRGAKIFNPAYVVSTCGQVMNKVDYVASVVRQVQRIKVPRVGYEKAYDALHEISGMGTFLSAQVVADLRNDRYLEPVDGGEYMHWSAVGPGSAKGLKLIVGENVGPKNYNRLIKALMAHMPGDIIDMHIHGQDLQNCLCEFSKYIRHLDKLGGRVRYYP